jgi:hypothetical protein
VIGHDLVDLLFERVSLPLNGEPRVASCEGQSVFLGVFVLEDIEPVGTGGKDLVDLMSFEAFHVGFDKLLEEA